jgi:hypothetical protein
MSSQFDELLKAAKKQDQPQRLLFLFAKTEAKKKKKGKTKITGTIAPLMCVDKLPAEIISFKALESEADSIAPDWDFIITASLSGSEGLAPSSDDADPHLNQMANMLASGEDLSRFMIFDREQQIVQVQTR